MKFSFSPPPPPSAADDDDAGPRKSHRDAVSLELPAEALVTSDDPAATLKAMAEASFPVAGIAAAIPGLLKCLDKVSNTQYGTRWDGLGAMTVLRRLEHASCLERHVDTLLAVMEPRKSAGESKIGFSDSSIRQKSSGAVELFLRLSDATISARAIDALNALDVERDIHCHHQAAAKVLSRMDVATHSAYLLKKLDGEAWNVPPSDDERDHADGVIIRRGILTALGRSSDPADLAALAKLAIRLCSNGPPPKTRFYHESSLVPQLLRDLRRCDTAAGAAGGGAAEPVWHGHRLLTEEQLSNILAAHAALEIETRLEAALALQSHPPSCSAGMASFVAAMTWEAADPTSIAAKDTHGFAAALRWTSADVLCASATSDSTSVVPHTAALVDALTSKREIGVRAAAWAVLQALETARAGTLADADALRAKLHRDSGNSTATAGGDTAGMATATATQPLRLRHRGAEATAETPLAEQLVTSCHSFPDTERSVRGLPDNSACLRRDAFESLMRCFDASELARDARDGARALAEPQGRFECGKETAGEERERFLADVEGKGAALLAVIDEAIRTRPALKAQLAVREEVCEYAATVWGGRGGMLKDQWKRQCDGVPSGLTPTRVLRHDDGSHGDGGTVMHHAARHSHLEIIEKIVEAAPHLLEQRNKDRMPPLCVAACASRAVDAAVLSTLLRLGASPLARAGKYGVAHFGTRPPLPQLTPLHLVAHFFKSDVARRDAGALVGRLPLSAEQLHSRLAAARVLVRAALSAAAATSDCYSGEHDDGAGAPAIGPTKYGAIDRGGRALGGTPADLASDAYAAYLRGHGGSAPDEEAGRAFLELVSYLHTARRLALWRELGRTRGIFLYWLEQAAISASRPGGAAQLRDLKAFVADFGEEGRRRSGAGLDP